MNFEYRTERLNLKILPETECSQVLAFYERNRVFLEPFELTRPLGFYTESFQRAQLHAELTLFLRGEAMRYYLFRQERPKEPIGCVAFQHIMQPPTGSCCIAYKLDQRFLHQGYITEALSYLMPLVVKEFSLSRVEADILEDNVPSRRVVELLGFHPEGIARLSHEICGVQRDHIRYAWICTNQ